MFRLLACSIPISAMALFAACSSSGSSFDSRSERVLTKEMQAQLTPDEVLRRLKAGNARFVGEDTVRRNHSEQVRKAVSGQYPKAIILSCVDSRVPVEDVMDQGIGDIFVARVAGNFVNEDILGSMEFATQVAGAKVVLVMGHEHCGAVKATIDRVEAGNMTSLVRNITPALQAVSSFPGEQNSKNPAFVHEVSESNIQLTMERIRRDSQILRDLEASGEIRIAGAMYDMDTGVVSFL